MWRFVAAVLLVAAAAGGQNRVIYDGTVQDDEVMVVAGQPQVVVLAKPRPQMGSHVVPAPSSIAQFVVVPQKLPQGQQLFQFLVPPMQQEILLPSPYLPASCGPFIVSLEHDTFRGRAYHFSWCHHAGQLYTHHQAAVYCHSLAEHQALQFEVLSLRDQGEVDFISNILQTHQISSVWTRDYRSSVPHNLQSYIDSSHPGEDCLSVEADLLALRRFWFHARPCLLHKAVICEADY